MALASMNPIRLADAHLMCTGEFLIRPAAPGRELGWLTALPFAFNDVAPLHPMVDIVPSLVIASAPEGVRTGLVLRMRMTNPMATPAQCQAAREERMPACAQILEQCGLSPARPIGGEGVYSLLPREGLRFLRRGKGALGQPLRVRSAAPLPFSLLESIVAANPGSGLCLTLFAHSDTQEADGCDFLLATWGIPAGGITAPEILHLPLTDCPEARAEDMATSFRFLYDPWALLQSILGETEHPALTSASLQELRQVFGEFTLPEPAASDSGTQPHGAGFSAGDVIGELRGSLPDMRSQMMDAVRLMRQGIRQQTTQAIGDLLDGVRQQIGQVTAELRDLPGAGRNDLLSTLERLNERMVTLPEALSLMRQAGLAQPIDTLTLLKMGFSSEQELIDLGMDGDLLDSLRSVVRLRQQCPRDCSSATNCMPYSMMMGYLYEALINRFFLPLFRATDGYKRAHHLGDYTKVNQDHCERLADFPRYRDRSMHSLTARDWAAWLTLCNAVRFLRNRQHSDSGSGFLGYDEMCALYDALLFPGQTAKTTLLRLPAFSSAPPAWAREFKPDLPPFWGETPDAQRKSTLRHVSLRTSVFTPSLLQFLIRCSHID